MVLSLFLCLGLFFAVGCGGDTGEALAKEAKKTGADYLKEKLDAGADKAKDKAVEDKWKPKIDAIDARVKKLSEAEKKIYDAKIKE